MIEVETKHHERQRVWEKRRLRYELSIDSLNSKSKSINDSIRDLEDEVEDLENKINDYESEIDNTIDNLTDSELIELIRSRYDG